MPIVIKRFSVGRLFGHLDLDIKIERNSLILVAENGSGKTTLLRMMYYFLSKQWLQLLALDFDFISAEINNSTVKFSKKEYSESTVSKKSIDNLIENYPIYKEFISTQLPNFRLTELLDNPSRLSQMEAEFDIPMTLLFRIVNDISEYQFRDIKAPWDESIIYLPTFRRIERDFQDLFIDLDKRLEVHLKSVLPKMAPSHDSTTGNPDSPQVEFEHIFSDLWKTRDLENWRKREQTNYPFELVEFGMSDVQYKISRFLNEISNSTDPSLGKSFKAFVDVCNKYLLGNKKIVVDNEFKSFTILSHENVVIGLGSLSSGEKQILSLFSHLYLNKTKPILIIDEPELSLSISWQENLLSDILSSGIQTLIAATHSPFIISDNMKSTTHGINEFVR